MFAYFFSAMYQDGKVWEGGAELIDRFGDDVQKGLWDLSEEWCG